MYLEFIGKPSPRRDLNAFHDELRAKYPQLSERGVHEVTKAELERTPPRYPGYVLHLIGEDIMTNDPSTIPAWPWMTGYERGRVMSTPLDERSRLVDPKGLARTYVWRKETDWVQDVTDADLEVIRLSDARTWFRNIERYGRWTPERAYDFPVIETHPMQEWNDVEAFRRDRERKPMWNGLVRP